MPPEVGQGQRQAAPAGMSVDQRFPEKLPLHSSCGDLSHGGHVGWWEHTNGVQESWSPARSLDKGFQGLGLRGCPAEACPHKDSPGHPSRESVRWRVCARRPQSHTGVRPGPEAQPQESCCALWPASCSGSDPVPLPPPAWALCLSPKHSRPRTDGVAVPLPAVVLPGLSRPVRPSPTP